MRHVTTQAATGQAKGIITRFASHLTLGRAALYKAILERSAALRAAAASLGQDVTSNPTRLSPSGPAAGGPADTPALQHVRRELDAAVDDLRRAGQQDDLPRGLITRAWCSIAEATEHELHGRQKQAVECESSAQSDLDEAWEIAERGPMKLHLCDIHLHRARLFRDKEELKRARALIEQCGYWRRRQELEEAEETATAW